VGGWVFGSDASNLEALVDNLLLYNLAAGELQPVFGLFCGVVLEHAKATCLNDDPAHLPVLSEDVAVALSEDKTVALHIRRIDDVQHDGDDMALVAALFVSTDDKDNLFVDTTHRALLNRA
jgi:hypothetical protein